jgi:hypothetical protein
MTLSYSGLSHKFFAHIRPFQENKPPKYKLSSEEKASGLEGFKFWNYLSTLPIKSLYREQELNHRFHGLHGLV